MTTNLLLEEAIKKQKRTVQIQKIENRIRFILRLIFSFAIPVTVAFVAAYISTTFFGKFHGETFASNLWYFFCKTFFLVLPIQVYFIVRKNKKNH